MSPFLVFVVALVGCGAGVRERPRDASIVLVVVDTLRADHLGAYGYARETSPRLDARVRSGRLYEMALATSPWTLPSFGSLFTGLYPTRHGCGYRRESEGEVLFTEIDRTVDSLAELLQRRGYETGAIVTNTFLRPVFKLDRGFDTYDCVAADNVDVRRADEVVDLALEWIDARAGKRFFLLVHFFDPHIGYDAPAPFRGRFTGEHDSALTLPVMGFHEIREDPESLSEADRAFVAAAYDEEIAFTDQEVGRLLDELERRGLLERGLVLLTSDHGEELFEHGGFEHGHAMWQELLRVPLVVWGAGVRAGREPAPVSLVDVAPTVLDFLGWELPEETAGVSLRPNLVSGEPLPARSLYAEGIYYGPQRKVVVDWPYKLVVDIEEGGTLLFDLDRDPGETRDLSASEPERLDRMMAALRERLRSEVRARVTHELFEIDPETERRLRSLGYLE